MAVRSAQQPLFAVVISDLDHLRPTGDARDDH